MQSTTTQAERSILKRTAAIGIAVATSAWLMPQTAGASLLTYPATLTENSGTPEVDKIRWYGHRYYQYGGYRHYGHGGHRWYGGPIYGYRFGYRPYWHHYGFHRPYRYY
jgi:hypothetical protein